mgnify:CR=1 FL=1
MKYRDTSSRGYGDMEDRAYCLIGVDNTAERYDPAPLMLTSNNPFPFRASCTVQYEDGVIEFLESVLPAQIS